MGEPVSCQHPGESFRHAVTAQRVSRYGGGACTVLVRSIDGRVELAFHADLKTAAVLTPEQAREIAGALTTAANRPS